MAMPGAALRCLRWDSEGDRRLAGLTDADWPDLFALVERGAGLSLLARRLRRARLQPPAPFAARLRAHGMAVAARTLQARSLVAEAIAATGRPMLLLKGIDLADRLYGNLGHRQMGDVDFLVKDEDAMAYHASLVTLGFNAAAVPDAAMRSADWQHHLIYTTPNPSQLPLELHWRLAGDRHGALIDIAGIWSRSLAHDALPPGARMMAPEDLFLYLCLHLQHHLFEAPLTSLWDIAELLDHPALPLDWRIIDTRAEAWALTDTVRLTLHLVTQTLGVPTQHLLDGAADPATTALLPEGLASLGLYSGSATIVGARLGQALAGESGWRVRCGTLLRGLVPPRLEVRTRYGRPDQGFWGDLRSYVVRFRAISRGKSAVLLSWMINKDGIRRSMTRTNRLRVHLDRQRRFPREPK
ncbi:MAG: nucleotidyltransferase family protein [Candidatus Sphingomonas phytovorans]|nr:nucleotidyltransferase family protein [Sphingomonas sp.]WEK00390.1 MAG: nucleotidyltransferase family protein [Sphingomonas sp.]